jgi:hypothetical protein
MLVRFSEMNVSANRRIKKEKENDRRKNTDETPTG